MIRSAYWEKISLAGWVLLILAIGMLPLKNFVGHSHWEYIKWIPTSKDLSSPAYLFDLGFDLIANTLLFLPLGYLLSRRQPLPNAAHRLLWVAAVGGLISLSIEWYQVYCHNRVPSVFDLMTNTVGAVLGAYLDMKTPWPAVITPSLPDHTPAPSNNE